MSRSPARHGLPYLPALDALRALAVTAVFAYHAAPADAPGGFIGVDVFFVLSGYLITSLLLREHEAGGISLRRFWARRARRLLPAVWVLLLVALLIAGTVLLDDLATTRRDALASVFYVQNWNLVAESESYFGAIGRPPMLQHLWSLAIEEQFYLVWPLVVIAVVRRFGRSGLLGACVAGAGASAALMWALYSPEADPSRVYYGTDTRATPLLVGAALAIVWPAGRLSRRTPRSAGLVIDACGTVALVGLLLTIFTVHDYEPGLYRGGFALVAVAAAVLVAALVHPGSRLSAGAARRPAIWVGQRSYGMYLWHWPVIVLTRPHIDVPFGGWPLIALQGAATVAIAAVSYRFVEQPIRRHGFLAAARRLRLLPGRAQRIAVAAGAAAVPLLIVWSLMLATPRSGLAARMHASAAALQSPTAAPHERGSRQSDGTTRPPSSSHRVFGDILAIGDSVMLGAANELQRVLGPNIRVDAAVGRQPKEMVSRLQAYRAAGALPPNVVVQIGDNGPVWYADLVHLREALSGVRNVIIVNVRVQRSWQDEVNTEVTQFVHRWPAARMADWYSVSGAAGLLWDGEHADARGQALYAKVVKDALLRGQRQAA